ncbi:MAG: hypothetical protein HY744_05875, partial [Deltaproteobacteria bacterium]|nr:hypothetical protein [Deltaproteobacteria bacterium]
MGNLIGGGANMKLRLAQLLVVAAGLWLAWALLGRLGAGAKGQPATSAAAGVAVGQRSAEPAPGQIPTAGAPWVAAGRERVVSAIHAAAGYLQGRLGQDGRFVYRVNLDGRRLKPRYNVVRHAGAIYALAGYHRQWPGPATKEAILRAARYLREQRLRPVTGADAALALMSSPDEEKSSTGRPEAKLGA